MATLSPEASVSRDAPRDGKIVRQFREVLLWPLQLRPLREGTQIQRHWEVLQAQRLNNPWHQVVIGPKEGSDKFEERHYNELVTFLPFVQRFLYGEGTGGDRESPMRVFRRDDIAAVRLMLRPGATPIVLDVAHIDLYFFFDIDVVILNVEVSGTDLSLHIAQDILYRFGRAYPAGWNRQGYNLHSVFSTEW